MYIKNSLRENQGMVMNMSKKVLLLFISIISMFSFLSPVYAAPSKNTITTKPPCMITNDPVECEKTQLCKWNNGKCEDRVVAEGLCDATGVKKMVKIAGYIFLIARFTIPFIIIGFGTFDLVKALTSSDDKMLGKQVKRLGLRVVAGVIVFVLPALITGILNMFTNDANDPKYTSCVECFLRPTGGLCK